jgi:hypothetical protein
MESDWPTCSAELLDSLWCEFRSIVITDSV